jgi:cytidine deaminase
VSESDLVEAARELARERFVAGWHSVAAALRTTSGRVFTAIHLDANVGRVSVCAEAIALGMAVAAGERDYEAIVAVRHPKPHEPDQTIQIVSPCGMCREMLTDYAPDIVVLLPDGDGGIARATAKDLLPVKYRRDAGAAAVAPPSAT